MTRLFVTLVANAIGLYLAVELIQNFQFTGGILEFVIAAVLFTLINWVIRPLIKLVLGPVVLLTLGLFIIVINMGMLWLLDFVTPSLTIVNLEALFFGTLLVGFINLLFHPIKSHTD